LWQISADPFAILDAYDLARADGPTATPDAPSGFRGGWLGYWGWPLLHRPEDVPPTISRAATSPSHPLVYDDRALRRIDGM
jgi:hypothetical protein